MYNYQVTIKDSSANLTAKDRIKYKDTAIAMSLDEATLEKEIEIDVKDYIISVSYTHLTLPTNREV
mgnify:CR=1 FL=1